MIGDQKLTPVVNLEVPAINLDLLAVHHRNSLKPAKTKSLKRNQ